MIQIHRFSPRIIELFSDAAGLGATLADKKVDAKAAKAYEEHLANGGRVMLVKAGFRPLRAAQITRDVTAKFDGDVTIWDQVINKRKTEKGQRAILYLRPGPFFNERASSVIRRSISLLDLFWF